MKRLLGTARSYDPSATETKFLDAALASAIPGFRCNVSSEFIPFRR